MNSKSMPVWLEPWEAAKRQFQQVYDLNGLLLPAVASYLQQEQLQMQGKLNLKLAFDEQRRLIVSGFLEGIVLAVCQRCMQDLPLKLSSSFSLVAVSSLEQAKSLPGELEAILLEQNQLSLIALVEQEVILSLPMVCMHEDMACMVDSSPAFGVADQPLPSDSSRKMPFVNLADQLKAS